MPQFLRRSTRLFVLLASVALLGFGAPPAASAQAPGDTSVPAIQGPITGPGPAYNGIRPGPTGTNLPDFDYITQEYFVAGIAGGQPYKTRIVVERPANPEKFTGLVVAEGMHFSGAALICQYARLGIAQDGDACLEVDAEPVDLGFLQSFNADRYGTLAVASGQTSDILAQVGSLIRSRSVGTPFAGLPLRAMVLSGTSESSNIARAYMTAYDNGLPGFRLEDGSAIYQGFFLTSTLGSSPLPITDVPTIQMPTQTEVFGTSAFQRPDSDAPGNRFRIYEVAGMSHADARDDPSFYPNTCAQPLSQFPVGAMTFMGLRHLLNWVAFGVVPPRAPYIAVNPDGQVIDGTRVALDQHGNALGGVRTAYLDVPIFSYTIPNGPSFFCFLTGYQTPLAPSVLGDLYKSQGQYIAEFTVRLEELTRQGWWPKEYTQDYARSDMLAYAGQYLG